MQKKLKSLFGSHHGLDEKSIDFLTKALEKNNLPGFDYIEFKQSLAALTDLDMSEEKAFKSAFATASTMGLTKDKLLKTADHYRVVLSKEKEQFDAALEKQVNRKVNAKLEEVKKLEKQIQDWKEKVRALNEKIEKSQAVIDNAEGHIKAAREKIEGTKENFEHTMQSILNEIDKDVESIEKYL